ncbi:MAG: glycosyltransferase family 9 protein [Candidatus Pacebacteria bacterium]|nr:glycosyltransferase family 9 protein [Candidatus Paceibacterota bacterium]
MGYGGALIWTALAANLKETYPNKKVLFIYTKGIKGFLSGKANADFVIYENNPDIDLILPKHKYFFQKSKFSQKDWIVVDMNNPQLQYWEKDTKEKVIYKSGKNAIEWACEYFKIKNALLKPVLRLTDKELKKVNELLTAHNLKKKDFIVIEPNSKESFAPNNQWFWDRWQELADLLRNKKGQVLVQLGAAGSPVLTGVVNLVGETSFREAGGVIGEAKLFVGYSGGLMHAAKAMDVKAVILASGFEPLEIANYPQNLNIYKKTECAPCGLKTPCPYGRKCMEEISVEEVYKSIIDII